MGGGWDQKTPLFLNHRGICGVHIPNPRGHTPGPHPQPKGRQRVDCQLSLQSNNKSTTAIPHRKGIAHNNTTATTSLFVRYDSRRTTGSSKRCTPLKRALEGGQGLHLGTPRGVDPPPHGSTLPCCSPSPTDTCHPHGWETRRCSPTHLMWEILGVVGWVPLFAMPTSN